MFAQALRSELTECGFAESDVYASSDPGSGPMEGEPLDEELKGVLEVCNLLIWIYTTTDKRWRWCTYEIGIAERSRVPTRVVVLRMFDDAPIILDGKVHVALTQGDIERFVRHLHKDPGYFPGYRPFRPRIAESAIKNRAKRLYQRLMEAKAEYKDQAVPIDVPRWGYITLQIDGAQMEPLYEKSKASPAAFAEACEALKDNLRLVDADDRLYALAHLGFADGRQGLEAKPSLRDIVSKWERALEDDRASSDWADDLVRDILRFRHNSGSDLRWAPLRSAHQDLRRSEVYYYPIVTSARKYDDGSRDYEVRLVRLPEWAHQAQQAAAAGE